MAIYGKPYLRAAKDTWDLMDRAGVYAIANDNILNGVQLVGVLLGSVIVGGVGAVLAVTLTGSDPIILFWVGIAVGWIIISMVMQIIDSAVATIFVCYSEQPQALLNHNRTLYHLLNTTDDM